MKEFYGTAVTELGGVLGDFFRTRAGVLEAAAEAIARSVRAGGKILLFGNGGSAAEAQHFAAELVNGMQRRGSPWSSVARSRPWAARGTWPLP